MPYKSEYTKQKIPRELDRRIKLSLDDKKEIKRLYGSISQRKLAKMFNVSRRLMTFIGCPEKKLKDLENRRLRGGSMFYYDKKKQVEQTQKTRIYRRELNKQKLLRSTK